MQFVGTGKDTRFPIGQPFDIPDGDTVTIEKIIAEGVAKPVDLVGQTGPEDPAKRAVELADADLRDDPMAHPQDAAIADAMDEDTEREIDEHHTPSAVPDEVVSKVEKEADEHSQDEGDVAASAATKRHAAAKTGVKDDAAKDEPEADKPAAHKPAPKASK